MTGKARDKYDRPLGVRIPRELRRWYEGEATHRKATVNALIVGVLNGYRAARETEQQRRGTDGEATR